MASSKLGIPLINQNSHISHQNSACSGMASPKSSCSPACCDGNLEGVTSCGRLAGVECGNVLRLDVMSFVGTV